jgi:hypothetical protein
MIRSIEIEFALPVRLTDDETRWLERFTQVVAKRNEPAGWVHWASGFGSKPHFNAFDCGFLGKPFDPEGPAAGEEPTFDTEVFYIETSARESYPDEESEKIRKSEAREKRKRSLKYRLRKRIKNWIIDLAGEI